MSRLPKATIREKDWPQSWDNLGGPGGQKIGAPRSWDESGPPLPRCGSVEILKTRLLRTRRVYFWRLVSSREHVSRWPSSRDGQSADRRANLVRLCLIFSGRIRLRG